MRVVAATEICWNVDLLNKKSFDSFCLRVLDQFLDSKMAYSIRYPRIVQRTNKF
jgi:hypothetical protein